MAVPTFQPFLSFQNDPKLCHISLLIRRIGRLSDRQAFPLLFPNDPLNSIHFVLVRRGI